MSTSENLAKYQTGVGQVASTSFTKKYDAVTVSSVSQHLNNNG